MCDHFFWCHCIYMQLHVQLQCYQCFAQHLACSWKILKISCPFWNCYFASKQEFSALFFTLEIHFNGLVRIWFSIVWWLRPWLNTIRHIWLLPFAMLKCILNMFRVVSWWSGLASHKLQLTRQSLSSFSTATSFWLSQDARLWCWWIVELKRLQVINSWTFDSTIHFLRCSHDLLGESLKFWSYKQNWLRKFVVFI